MNSILSAGFSDNYENWHITKHDVYGERFREAWVNRQQGGEINPQDLENIEQDDDIDVLEGIAGEIDDLELN